MTGRLVQQWMMPISSAIPMSTRQFLFGVSGSGRGLEIADSVMIGVQEDRLIAHILEGLQAKFGHKSGGDALDCRSVEAIQHRLGHQRMRAQRRGH